MAKNLDDFRDEHGRLKKGHPGFNQHSKVADTSPPLLDADTDNDFDTAILAAANNFGRAKPKTGLPGYCASLRDQRPQDFALLVTRALARRTATPSAAAIPITIEIVPCPVDFFIPGPEAQALWAARTGGAPVLVIDNDDTALDTLSDDDDDTPDNEA